MSLNKGSNYLKGAEALVKLLDKYEVQYIFGLCGDTSLPFYDALYRLDHSIKHILTRDERSASYMAARCGRVLGRMLGHPNGWSWLPCKKDTKPNALSW